MPEPVQYQYVLPLTVLDEVDAVFSKEIEDTETQVSIPTPHWIELGRPGEITVTIDPRHEA